MAETTKKATPSANSRVEVKLPLNKGQNANQDEFFSVNFQNYIIKRGEYVAIPQELYEVIKNAENAEEYAIKFAEEKKLREA